jgi:SAM-dependent methyltransferase
MPILNHTYRIGEIKYCQICNKTNLFKFLDLGFQPLSDDLKEIKNGNSETMFYPLSISFCKSCILLQNDFIVGDKNLYPKTYHYLPGITKDVVKNFSKMSKFLIKNYNLNKKKDLIVDAGCNDGSLLKEFKNNGIKRVVGIDPTDTVYFSRKKGVPTIQDFFNIKSSLLIKKKYGKAKIITTTNVFAHTNNLKEFILAAKKLLAKDGVFVIENHYLLDVVKKIQFDTFYHEHLRTYSLTSLIKLLKYYNLYLIDAYTSDRYGGNIQAHFSNLRKKYNVNIISILNSERKNKLNDINTYIKFKKKINKAKEDLRIFIKRNSKKNFVAKAYPARASILLHHFDYLKSSVNFVAEQPSSKKLNFFVPGTNLKILSSELMKKKEPDYVIILAWHLFDTIYNKWKRIFKTNVKFIKPLPKLEIK